VAEVILDTLASRSALYLKADGKVATLMPRHINAALEDIFCDAPETLETLRVRVSKNALWKFVNAPKTTETA
jgi:hypothetical protein